MDDEVIDKIRRAIAAIPLREPDVHHLFALARKLIERVPSAARGTYSLLNFYCDWTLHSEIDRSEAGAKILARLHEIIADHLKKADNSTLITDLSRALSLSEVRGELNSLIARYAGGTDAISTATWRRMVPILLEIISHTPLKIGSKNAKLKKLATQIRARPLKGKSVVEELAVAKVASTMLKRNAPPNEITYCLMFTTTDTTKLIVPISPV
jgi:hypothetical protein